VKTLAGRISLLSIGIAVLTSLLAGALALGLIRNSGASAAQRNLGRLADVAQSAAEGSNTVLEARRQVRSALAGLNVRLAYVRPNGRVLANNRLVKAAFRPDDVTNLLAGRALSATRSAAGNTVFLEGRPVAGRGGIVLVQKKADAVAPEKRALRRTGLALLIAGSLAGALGLLVAWRLARPLRRTAAAAHALAGGRRDVTLPAEGPAEVVEVSEAINGLAGALRQSEARQRHFLLSVSHDLRTPLTSLTGYAESLAEGVVPPEETARVGGVMLGEAQRLERLVGDLLDLARLGAQDFRVEFAPVDLTALVGAAAGAWANRCAGAGVEFRLDAPAGPLWVSSDANRLRQVLDGLFDNALRVTPAGAPIVLAARLEPGVAVVEVRDGGPGLADADLAVAFEQGALYERYRGVRQVGTGLGLAIVHGLVRRLGATIEAGHAPEGGARFTVRLPLLAVTS